MIQVTRLNGSKFFINEDMIEIIEETPDTVITLNTERKLVVSEPAEELLERITRFRRRIYFEKVNDVVIKGE